MYEVRLKYTPGIVLNEKAGSAALGQSLTFPSKCVCCLGEPTPGCELQAQVTSGTTGHMSRTDTIKGVPYCRTCFDHRFHYQHSGYGVLGILVAAISLAFVAGIGFTKDWSGMLIPIGGGVLLGAFGAVSFWPGKTEIPGRLLDTGCPFYYKGMIGHELVFLFTNRQYAEEFRLQN